MKDFRKPMKYLTIYMGYKYEKFLCQNILLFRNNRMENVWPILVRSIIVKILAFLNIYEKYRVVNKKNSNETYLLAFCKADLNYLIHFLWTPFRVTNKYQAALFLILQACYQKLLF